VQIDAQRASNCKTSLTHRRPSCGYIAVRVISGCILLALCSLDQAEGQASMPTILVMNYSLASSGTVKAAEAEAGRILEDAGVRTSWFNCPGPSPTRQRSICDNEQAPGEIRLRILSGPVQTRFRDGCFGFAIAPVFASVYYEPTAQLGKAHSLEFAVPMILGGMIAHEIGHLLLGPNSHSPSGIMQARWQAEQVQQLLKGALVFDKRQSAVMQAEVQRRMEVQGTDESAGTLSLGIGAVPVQSLLSRP
jgi:hypothetical protein